MARKDHIILFCYLLFFFPFSTFSTCVLLNSSSICYNILKSSTSNDPIYFELDSSISCWEFLEYQLLSSQVLSWDLVSDTCKIQLAWLTCRETYPSCDLQTLPCQNTCENIIGTPSGGIGQMHNNLIPSFLSSVCSDEDKDALAAVSPQWINLNCSRFPTSSCLNFPITSPVPLPITPTCRIYNGTVCSQDTPYLYFFNTNDTDITATEAYILDISTRVAALGDTCANSLRNFFCSVKFPRCNNRLLSTELKKNFTREPAFDIFTCRDTCEAYLTDCAPIWWLSDSVKPDCNHFDIDYWFDMNRTRYLPTLTTTTMMTSSNCSGIITNRYAPLSTMISNFSWVKGSGHLIPQTMGCISAHGEVMSIGCPIPSVNPDSNYIGWLRHVCPTCVCEFPCPATYAWLDSEWNIATNIMYVSIPSFILNTFMLLTWIIFPIKRSQQHVLSFIFCCWLISFVLVFSFVAVANNKPGLQDLKYIGCKNNIEPYNSEVSFCTFQAFILFVGLLAATCWWLVIAVDVFVRSHYLIPRYEEQRRFWIYHLFAWGFPFLMFIIFIAAGGRLGGPVNNIFLFCFMNKASNPADPWVVSSVDGWLDYLTWFGPIGLMSFIGLILIFLVLRMLYNANRELSPSNRDNWTQYIRSILFVASFWAFFFWLFFYRIEFSRKFSTWATSYHKWEYCIAQYGILECGSYPPERLTTWVWYGLHFSLAFQGILLTLSWGTQWENIELWLELFKVKTGRGREGREGSTTTRPLARSMTHHDHHHDHHHDIEKRKNHTRTKTQTALDTSGTHNDISLSPPPGADGLDSEQIPIHPNSHEVSREGMKTPSIEMSITNDQRTRSPSLPEDSLLNQSGTLIMEPIITKTPQHQLSSSTIDLPNLTALDLSPSDDEKDIRGHGTSSEGVTPASLLFHSFEGITPGSPPSHMLFRETIKEMEKEGQIDDSGGGERTNDDGDMYVS